MVYYTGGRIGSELLLWTQNHHHQSESSAELPEGASGAGMAPRWVPSPLGSYFFVLAVVIGFLGAERGDFRGFPRFRIRAKMSQIQRFLTKIINFENPCAFLGAEWFQPYWVTSMGKKLPPIDLWGFPRCAKPGSLRKSLRVPGRTVQDFHYILDFDPNRESSFSSIRRS